MFTDKYANETFYGPSMEVVKARHKAAMTHKCNCGKKRDPSEVKQIGSRRWILCHRCFGTIKQL